MRPPMAGWALAAFLAACQGKQPPSTRVTGTEAPALPVVPVPAAAPPVTGPAAVAVAAAGAGKPGAAEELRAEEREQNPRSEKVKIKLFVSPPGARSIVWWGRRKLGALGPMPLEFERPRNSGPVDLMVEAEGYLRFHTRIFTDRDDKLTVRLYRPDEATRLIGYRRSTAPEK